MFSELNALPKTDQSTAETAATVRAIRDFNALAALRPAWEELLAAVPTATIFSSWEWLSAWWSAYGVRRELITLAFFDPRGRLVALAPLTLETKRVAPRVHVRIVRLLGDGSGDSDNLDFLVLPGWEACVAGVVLDYLADQGSEWDVVQLNTFSDESPNVVYLLDELQARRWTWVCHEQPGIIIDLPNLWEEYLQGQSSHSRWKLRRHLRDLEKTEGARIRRCGAKHELPESLASFFELHQRRWEAEGDPGSFACPERRHFYQELSPLLLDRGRLEFWFLELNGRVVAGEFDFRYNRIVHNLQVAYDPAYASFRPGQKLRTWLLRCFIGSGLKAYDFLGGDQPYKEHWGGRTRYYRDIHFAIPRTAGSTYVRLAAAMITTKKRVRSHVPPEMWETARRFKQKLSGSNQQPR